MRLTVSRRSNPICYSIIQPVIFRSILCIIFFLSAAVSVAQVNNYSFISSAGGSLTNLTAPVNLIGGSTDDRSSGVITLPFTFNYGGTDFTQFSVSSNGLLGFGATQVTSSSTNSIGTLNSKTLAPFWDDLVTNTQGSATGVQYQVFGSAPNRIVVVQWTAYSFSTASSVQFQCSLAETTHAIRFMYGVGIGESASVALVNNTGNYLSVRVSSNSVSTTVPDNNSIFPSAGRTYEFTPAPVCSGTPLPGSAITSIDSVCHNTSFTLTLSGSSTERNISYQWQNSPDGISFTNIPGATSSTLNRVQSASTCYRALVTCTPSGLSATSSHVFVASKAGVNCLCIPPPSSNNYCSFYIEGVTTTRGLSNFTNVSNCVSSSYTNFSNTKIASQYQGQPLTLTFTSNQSVQGYTVWIDYNDNGNFETSERVIQLSSNAFIDSAVFTVPINAPPGTHRMRIRNDVYYYYNGYSGTYMPSPPNNSCSILNFGETEDYAFTVVALPACTGSSAPGNTISSLSAVCPATVFRLSLQNQLLQTGLSFQWQFSPDNVTYTNIVNATGSFFDTSQSTALYYRCMVSCSNSSTVLYSTPVQVNINPVSNCYCVPAKSTSLNCAAYYISNVSVSNTITGFNNSSQCSPNSYSFYSTINASQYQGQEVVMNFSSGGNYMNYAVWIDLNDNGNFETSEKLLVTPYVYQNNITGTFLVPLTAPVGAHRMRVRSEALGYSPPSDGCTPALYGETEDYIFNVVGLPACTGSPAPGNTLIAGGNSVCAGRTFKLSLQTKFINSGITYQWQSSPDGTTFTNIAAATDSVLNTSQTSLTWYRCIVSCNASGSTPSVPLQVTMNALQNCYCIPPTPGNTCINFIDNVTTSGGITNFNNNSGCALTAYSNFSNNFIVSQYQGMPVNFSFSSFIGTMTCRVWVDFNDDGNFSNTELLLTNSTGSGSIMIPSNATPGTHRMRITGSHYYNTSDPCASADETEDYGLTVVVPLPSCTGAPSPGLTLSSVPSVCTADSVMLSLENRFIQTGISYQWQSSPNGVTYTNIPGADSATHKTYQSASTWYKCIVTCSGGLSGTSTAVNVTMKALTNCYCTPSVTNNPYSYISKVSVTEATTNFENSSAGSASGYVNYSNIVAAEYRGGAVTLTTSSSQPYTYAAWIDFDDNGVFDPSEKIIYNTNPAGSLTNVVSVFTVPVNATAGIHRMRIIGQPVNNIIPAEPCTQANGAETEDYSFQVLVPPACSGSPAPGNTISTSGTVCTLDSFTLSLQNIFIQSGISYQWQSSPNGTTYTNIAGANASTYTTSQGATTYYRCIVTCANSGSSVNSTPLQVFANPLTNCYCTPLPSTNACASSFITNVKSLDGVVNFTNTTACSFSSFTNYSATKIVSQYQGRPITLSFSSSGAPMSYAIWIDFNDDGIFSTGERIVTNTNAASALTDVTVTFTIPVGAPAGTHRMRVRGENYQLAPDACGQLNNGETEDYGITVLVSAACSGIPSPGATISSEGNVVCAGKSFTLSLQNNTLFSGTGYQWQSSVNGTVFTNIAGATAFTYTSTQSTSLYYRCLVTCYASGDTATSGILNVTLGAASDCYCTPATSTYACTDTYLSNVKTTGGITNFDNNSLCAATSYSNFTAQSVSQAQGSTVLFSFSSSGAAMRYIGWIDYNQDGIFGPSENVLAAYNNNFAVTNVTTSYLVPATAVPGNYRLRIRAEHYAHSNPYNPCTSVLYGETEDYSFIVTAAPPVNCVGFPDPGATLTSGSNPVCAGTEFILSIQNTLTAPGYNYQWQSSIDGINYTNLPYGTATTYTASQHAANYYRCLVTCTYSNSSAASTPLYIPMNAIANCICIPQKSQNACGNSWYISNINTSGGLTNFNNTSTCAARSYTDYSASMSASQYQGESITLNFASNAGVFRYAVWIDFNDDGVFSASERVITNNNPAYSLTGVTSTYVIPLNAAVGTHRMRVRGEYYGYPTPADACNTLYYGETEDYAFTVLALPACSGIPAPGNTISSLSNPLCAIQHFTLSIQNTIIQSGISYQWQSSADGISYTDIPGAIADTVNMVQLQSTYYRCRVTCSGSGSIAYSTALQVITQAATNCYCSPPPSSNAGYACTNNYYTSNISTSSGVTNFANASLCAASSYTNYTASKVASQYRTGTLGFTITTTVAGFYHSLWIDYNDDGIFASNERILANIYSNTTSFASSFQVPASAPLGTHRMRFRSDLSNYADNACSILQYGETEDYGFTVLSEPACAGAPAPGNTLSSGANPVCSGVSFTLSLQNNPIQLGLTYQWQTSSNGTSWTNITGATSKTYATSQTVATWYRCQVTCSTSGQTGNSSSLNITMNALANCYCVPPTALSCAVYMSNVSSTGGVTNFTNATGCASGSFANYAATKIVSQYQGQVVNLSFAATGGTMGHAVWIDLNDDAIFSPGEKVLTTITGSGSFTIPNTAPLGTHRMRVRAASGQSQTYDVNGNLVSTSYYAYAPSDPCTFINYSETEDYALTVLNPLSCSGTPAPGSTTITGSNPICAGVNFTLGIFTIFPQTGITYQWQASLDGTNYFDIPGATDRIYTTSQSRSTYYRCRVTCSNSNSTGSSTPLNVTMTAPNNCYCIPPTSNYACNTYSGYVSNVSTTGGTVNFSNASACAATSYTNYFSTKNATQVQGAPITLQFTSVTRGLSYSVWVDFDDDGIFETPEKVATYSNSTNSLNVSVSFTVPLGAPTGAHRMRVRSEDGQPPAEPCNQVYYGETEDYSFTVAAVTGCTGTPAPGNTISTSNSICPSTPFTLSLSNTLTQSGLTFQWQSSTNGSTYQNISGANFSTYTTSQTTATFYRCLVRCANSNISATSTALNVSMAAVSGCYCTPGVSYSPCGTSYGHISNVVTTGGIANFTNASGCTASSYTNYSATKIVSQYQGQIVSLALTTTNGPLGFSVWIDYDNNGLFEPDEKVITHSNGSYLLTVNGSFMVPTSVAPGTYRMRIRGDYYYSSGWYSYYSYPLAPSDPCSQLYRGESEDYAVTVVAPPACTGTPTAGTASANTTSVCGIGSVSLALTGSSTSMGILYQWQESRDGSAFVNIPGATAKNHNTASLSGVHTYAYKCVVTCTNSNLVATSNTVTINAYEIPSIRQTTTSLCPGASTVLTAFPAGKTYAWSGGQTTQSITVSTPGSYSVTVTQGGCVTGTSVYIAPLTAPAILSTTASPATICIGDSSTLTVIASFNGAATYCNPFLNCNTFGDYISNVNFAGINRTSVCDGTFSINTTPNPTITTGSTYVLSVATGGERQGVAAWIDYDQDGSFENHEIIYHNYSGAPAATYSANILIPTTALNGSTRMRVRSMHLGDPITAGPCGSVNYGEAEDYALTISGGVDPMNYTWTPSAFLNTTTGSAVNATNVTSTTTYSVLATGSNGCSTTSNVTLTVNPLPQGTLSGNTICEGGTGLLTFTATTGTGPFTIIYNDGVSNITKTNVASGTPFPVNTNPTSTTSYTLISVTASSGCSRSTGFTGGTATITITAAPAITLQPQNVVTCAGSTVSFTVTATGAAMNYQWQLSTNNGSTWTNIVNNATYTGALTSTLNVVNPAVTLNGYQYRVLISGSCTTTSAAATLSVSTAAAITTQPQNRIVCEGSNTSFTVAATGSPLTYQWQSSTDGVSWNAMVGETAATLSLSSVSTALNGMKYRVVVSSTGCPSINSNAVTLTVNAGTSIGTQPQSSSVCTGSTANFGVTATGTSLTYQWQLSTNNGNSWSNITGANSTSFSITNASTSNNGYQYRVVISGGCSPAVNSNAATLTVSNAAVINTHPQSTTVCAGSNAGFTINAAGSGLNYQWQSSVNGTVWNDINGETSPSLNLSTVTIALNGMRYRVILTASCGSAQTSNAAMLTVDAAPSLSTQPADITICAGSTANLSVSATGAGLSYQWQTSTNNGSSWTAVTGATSASLNITTTTAAMNGYQYRVIVSGSCTPSVTSSAAILTVSNSPSLVSQPTDIGICAGSAANFSVSATGAGISYQWQLSTNNGSSWTAVTGATSASLNISSATASMNGYQYRVSVTGSCTPSVTSNAAILTVNSSPSLSAHPADLNVCAGSAANFSVSATGAGLTYQWQLSTNNGSAWTDVTGAASASLNIPAAISSMNGYQYRVIVSGTCTPAVTSSAAILTVNSSPSLSSQPSDVSVCEGNAASFSVNATGTGLNYQWQTSTNNGANWTNVSGATSASLNFPAVTSSMNGYQYRVNVNGSCTPSVTSNAATITVHTSVLITLQPSDITICAGLNALFATNATGTGQSFQWQQSINNGLTWTTVSGANTSSLTITGVTASQNNTLYRTLITGLCTATPVISNAAKLTVISTATISAQPLSQTVCEGKDLTFSVVASGTGINYQWQVSADGTNWTNITGANAPTLNLNGVAYLLNGYQYRAEITSGTCAAPLLSNAATLTVNPRPLLNGITINSPLCLGSVANFGFGISNNVAVTTSWNFGDGNISSVTNPAHTYAQATTYAVRLMVSSSAGCLDSLIQNITVNAKPTASFIVNNTVQCLTNNNFIFSNTSNGASGYQWSFGDGNVSSSSSPAHVYANVGTYVVKLVTISPAGCADSTSQSITVAPQPVSAFTVNIPTQCISGNSFSFSNNSSITTGSLTYAWNFGDGNTSGAQGPTYSYSSSGIFPVKLIATSNVGCQDSITQMVTVSPKPAPAFTVNNIAQCLNGNNFVFTNTSGITSGSLIYQWNFGDGNSSVAAMPAHVYSADGNYTVKLIVTSNNGCKDSVSLQVQVYPQPVPAFTVNADTQCLNGNNFIFTNGSTISNGTLSYTWRFDDGATSNTPQAQHIYNTAGNYAVMLTAVSANGCRDSIARNVSVLPKPAPSFTVNNPNQCRKGNNFLFTNTSSITSGNISYAWSFGDGSVSTAPNPSHAYTLTGSYVVKLVVTSAYGCKDSISATMQVYPDPVAAFSVNTLVQCVNNNNYIFTNNSVISSGSLTYLWNFGDGNNSIQRDASHVFANAGIYPVQLSATSTLGCRSDTTITVTVKTKPQAAFTVNDAEQCKEGNIFYFNNLSVNNGPVNFTWMFGDGSGSTAINPSRQYLKAGVFEVKLVSAYTVGCISDTAKMMLTVNAHPTVSAGPDQTILEGNSPVMKPIVTGTNLSYKWSPNTYFISQDTIAQPLIIPKQDIVYKLTVTGEGGCTSADEVLIRVLKKPEIPNSFSPNNDGINDVWEIKYLNNYPGCTVQIFTRHGQVIFESRGYRVPWDGKFNGKELPVGTYYYVIDPKNGRPPVTGFITIIK